MFDMGAGSLAQLYVDLDPENHAREGVIMDVRHNNGGFVNPYAFDIVARRGYMTMTPRGGTESPPRTVIGEPTAGWIIYTSNESLIDGSSLLLPSTMIRRSDGKVMEMNPRPVDVLV